MTNEAAERPDRLIRVSKEFLDNMASRTSDGYRIDAYWGEPDADGIYEPTLRVHYTDDLKATERKATVNRIKVEVLIQRNRYLNPSAKIRVTELLAILDAAAEP